MHFYIFNNHTWIKIHSISERNYVLFPFLPNFNSYFVKLKQDAILMAVFARDLRDISVQINPVLYFQFPKRS